MADALHEIALNVPTDNAYAVAIPDSGSKYELHFLRSETAFSSANVTAAYARIDGLGGQPGYFTAKANS